MRQSLTVFLSLLFLMAFTPAHASRLALVIGNGDYKNVLPLANPVNDANDMAEILKNLGFKVILKRNADQKTMVNAVQNFGAQLRRADSVGLFYFAGHGLQFNNRNFLMPIGANIKSEADIEFEAVDVNRVLAQIKQANNGLNIVILDACRDSFTARRFYGRGFLGRCLTHIDSPKSTFIAYATAPGEVAKANSGRNGTLTKHLLAALRDKPNLMIADLFIEVAAQVEKETNGQQRPWQSMSLTRQFCFGKCGERCVNCSQLLCKCEEHFKANRLTRGKGGNALACYKKVLKRSPTNAQALSGLAKIEARLVILITRALDRAQRNKAKRHLASLRKVNPKSPKLAALETRLHSQLLRQCDKHFKANRLTNDKSGNALACYKAVLGLEPTNAQALSGLENLEARLVTLITRALDWEQRNKAKRYLAALRQVNPKSPMLAALETRLQLFDRPPTVSIQQEPTPNNILPADQIFREPLKDGNLGPEMVWVTAGKFRIGDIQGRGDNDERPVHWVPVNRFAMGRYEVTFAAYDHFALATGRKLPKDKGWGRADRPAINVSWNDATAYADWLSQQTGRQYRLPTEAEWEYAARAGTETLRYWGNEPDEACRYANVADKTLEKKWNWAGVHNCTDGYQYTAPVDSFQPNDFGLFNMLGNVWEWTCSEYERKYGGKEQQCVDNKNTHRRVVSRGGSWSYKPGDVRAANRLKNRPAYRSHNIGFRLVRE